MKNFKIVWASLFKLSSGERIGMLFLAGLILGLLYLQWAVDFSSEISQFDISSDEIQQQQLFIDSLRLAEIERRKPKIYPFNPNFITDYKAYTLGMSTEEYDRLKSFRDKNKWVNSKTDFQRVTRVSDSLLATISPYFKFPKWVTQPRAKYKTYSKKEIEKPYRNWKILKNRPKLTKTTFFIQL